MPTSTSSPCGIFSLADSLLDRLQARDKESKLPMLLKMLVWAQDQLKVHAACPRIEDLMTASLTPPTPISSVSTRRGIVEGLDLSGDDDPRY